MSGINYKQAYQTLKRKYPSIANELAPKPQLTDQSLIPEIFGKFCQTGNFSADDIKRNKDDLMLLFIAVVVSAYDPAFFVSDVKPIQYKLRAQIAELMDCHKTWISHLLKSVRVYMRIRKAFRMEVDYFYTQVISNSAHADTNT
jgi:hypothetical protein